MDYRKQILFLLISGVAIRITKTALTVKKRRKDVEFI